MQTPPGFRGPFRTDDRARALYSEGAGIFRIVPAAVALPSDLDDLIALVRWAGDTDSALIPRSAGSGMPGGNVGPGVVVDLRRAFRQPPVIEPGTRTARAGASVTCAALNAAAGAHGLRLPAEPSSGKFCTLGGMVATNAAGARSYRFGAMREWVNEVGFVTTDGEAGRATTADPVRAATTSAERRLLNEVAPFLRGHQQTLEAALHATRKNSSGYKLTGQRDHGWVRHLLIGSEGTLAFIVGVEVRLVPLPQRVASMLIPLTSLDAVAPMVTRLAASKPAAIELLDRTYLEFVRALGPDVPPDAEAVLLVDFEDDAAGEAQSADFGEGVIHATSAAEGDRIWSLRHRASPILAGLPDTTRSLQVIEDGCVPLPRLGEYIAGLRRIATGCGFRIVIFGHAGDAHVHANLLADVSAPDLAGRLSRCLEEASSLQISLGGTTSGEHGDGRLRAPFLERSFGPVYVDACRRVKKAFDPREIMNPGVKLTKESTVDSRPLTANVLKVGLGAPSLPPGVAELLRDIERGARWGEDRLSLLPSAHGQAL